MATAHGLIEIIENSQSISGNYTSVTANFYVVRDSGYAYSGYATYPKLTFDGTTVTKTLSSYDLNSSNTKVLLGSITKNVYHNSDGTKTVSASFTWDPSNSYLSTVTGSTSKTLTKIPRYATVSQSLNSRSINSIKINWSSDSTIDYIWYSTNNGSSWTGINVTDGTSGTYTISNLSPNTTYKIKTRVRRKDSQLTTDSSALSVTTYDIAKISSATNFDLGSNASVTITNPASATATLVMKIGTTQILSKNLSTGTNSISFSDTQLDTIYKKFSTSNTLTVSYTLTTNSNSSWTSSKSVICTLTGNQKTGHRNVNGSWKRTKHWININGSWKRSVRWININGSWKRCI